MNTKVAGPTWLRLFVLGIAMSLAPPAHAARIDVMPGPSAITNAVNSASPGDLLFIHAGDYVGSVDVNKPLKIIGDSTSFPLIDAQCGAPIGLRISASGVIVKNLRVANASVTAIDIQNVENVMLKRVLALANPGGVGCGTEQYGINVYQATRIKLLQVVAAGDVVAGGFQDAGIYIGGIAAEAKVKVNDVVSGNNIRGILVEDSLPQSVLISSGDVSSNDTGVLLRNSDGVRIKRLIMNNNSTSGIELDSNSDANVIKRNTIHGSTLDVVDNGTGNCWKKNTFTTGTVPTDCP